MAVCEQCRAESPSGSRFCGSCGAKLATRPMPRETRKVVTALFCDVSGSTALGEQLDPEVWRSVIQRYFSAMRATIERHGGTVEKFIGDALVAVFGVPRVREDDALRAVRAASAVGSVPRHVTECCERQRRASFAACGVSLDRAQQFKLISAPLANRGHGSTASAGCCHQSRSATYLRRAVTIGLDYRLGPNASAMRTSKSFFTSFSGSGVSTGKCRELLVFAYPLVSSPSCAITEPL